MSIACLAFCFLTGGNNDSSGGNRVWRGDRADLRRIQHVDVRRMKVSPKTLDFPLAMSDPNRGKTLIHASDIYNRYYEQANPGKYGKREGDSPDMLFAEGLAWEQYFEKALIANGVQCFRPGELIGEWKKRKVAYSPDLIITNGKDRIGEIKKTWKSSRLKPTDKDFAKYKTQACMYAYFLDIPRVTWFINHTVGNWRDYTFPQLRVWEVEFTKREILEEMRTMMHFAESEGLFEPGSDVLK